MNPAKKKTDLSKWICPLIIAVLSVIRIVISCNAYYYVIEGSIFDDNLQISNAIAMSDGQWMGVYDNPILCKNPGFPMFLSFAKALHIPYGVLYGILIVAACLLLIRALAPCIKSAYFRTVMFAVFVFIPINHEAAFRIYRNALVPYFALLVVAAMIGLYFRRKESVIKRLLWSLAAFFGFGGFYLLREDGMWMLPFTGVICLILLAGSLLKIKDCIRKKISILTFVGLVVSSLIPMLAPPVFTKAVSMTNKKYYGYEILNDRTTGNEAKAIGLLYKIKEGSSSDRDVWVSRQTLSAAMEVSPTLASVPEVLDYIDLFGPVFLSDPGECNGDGIVWAIRSGVQEAGHYKDLAETEQFYGQIALELEEAYTRGRLSEKEGILLSAAVAPLLPQDFTESLSISARAMVGLSHFPDCVVKAGGEAFDETIAKAELATGHDLSDRESLPAATKILNGLSQVYKILSYPAGIVMTVLFIILTVMLVKKRLPRKRKPKVFDMWLMSLGVFLCSFSNVYLSVLFLRFVSNHRYTSGVFGFYDPSAAPLMYVAGMIILYAFFKAFYPMINRPQKSD